MRKSLSETDWLRVEFTIRRIGGRDNLQMRDAPRGAPDLPLERQFGPYIWGVQPGGHTAVSVAGYWIVHQYLYIRLDDVVPALDGDWWSGRLQAESESGSPHGRQRPFLLYGRACDVPTYTLVPDLCYGTDYGVYSIGMRCVTDEGGNRS